MKAVKVALVIVLCGVSLNAWAEWGRTADDFTVLPFLGSTYICADGGGGCWATGMAGQGVGVVHFDRNGDTTWGAGIVQALPTWRDWNPRPLSADNGDVIVTINVTIDVEAPTDSIAIFLQRINLEGELVWGQEGIALDTSNRRQGILRVYNGPIDDTYLIHWTRSDDDFQNNDPRLQLVNGAGELLWGIGGLALNWPNTNSKIVTTSDHSVIALQNVAPTPAIEIVKINSDGERLWNSTFLTLWESVAQRTISDAESDREGGVILVYEYEKDVSVDNDLVQFRGINALRISGDGDSLWTTHVYERRKDGFEQYFTINPIINYAGSGRFFIAWIDYPDVFKVVALNVDGDLLWNNPFDVITSGTGHSLLNGVDSENGVCYVWKNIEDGEQENRFIYHQWGQRINLEGERLWEDSGRVIQARNLTRLSAITDGNGGTITHVDFNNGTTFQLVNRNGEIGEVLPVGVGEDFSNDQALPGAFSIQLYPNPVNSHFRIVFDSAVPNQTYSYSLFDGAGRSVRSGVIPDAGYFTGDLSRLASGQYFLRLQSKKVSVTKEFMLVR